MCPAARNPSVESGEQHWIVKCALGALHESRVRRHREVSMEIEQPHAILWVSKVIIGKISKDVRRARRRRQYSIVVRRQHPEDALGMRSEIQVEVDSDSSRVTNQHLVPIERECSSSVETPAV